MLKKLIIGALICLTGALYAQTDEQNAAKYWKFRNNFRRDFIKIRSGQGKNMPTANLHHITPQKAICLPQKQSSLPVNKNLLHNELKKA